MDVRQLAAGRVPAFNPLMVDGAPRGVPLRGVLALLVLLLASFILGTSNGLASPRVFAAAHPRGLDFVNQSGRHFLVEDAYIGSSSVVPFLGGNTIHLLYRASDITPRLDTAAGSLSQPTVIVPRSANVSLTPTESTVRGETGNPTVEGEATWRFQGKVPHHLHLSVVEILGDPLASWSFDLDI